MSYFDIFVIGWSLNVLMFVINFLIVLNVIKSYQSSNLREQSRVLNELKQEFDHYYPYRKYTIFLTYLLPFTAFFRMSYRLIEMRLFFSRNNDTTMYDYMMYKYESDINQAKERH